MRQGFGPLGTAIRGMVPAVPKIKARQQDVSKAKGDQDVEDCKAVGASAEETASQKENSPPAQAVKSGRARQAGTAKKGAGAARSRAQGAAGGGSKAASPAAARSDDDEPDLTKGGQEAAVAPAHGARQLRPSANGGDAGGEVLRTGDEIWRLNMQLGAIAESLGDPEDAKPRRRFKEPTLQEKLHKEWGGTYGERLEREFAPMDVEPPPAPKYEPPTFLEEAVDSDDDVAARPGAAAPETEAPAPERGRNAGPATTHEDPDDEPGPITAAPAAAAPPQLRKGATAGTAGRAAGRGKAAAGTAAGSKNGNSRGAAGAAERRCSDAETLDGHEEGRQGEDTQQEAAPSKASGRGKDRGEALVIQPVRRNARKAAPTAAPPPATKAPQSRPAARQRTTKASAAAAAAADADAGDTGPATAHAEPPTAPAPTTVTRLGTARKTHLPLGAGFGPASSKPPHPAPPLFMAGLDDGLGCSCDMAAPGARTAGPAKRARDSVAVGDAARLNKVVRLEEQQLLLEIESLRKQKQDLESRNERQNEQLRLQEQELKDARRKAEQAEKGRGRDAMDISNANDEIKKLKAIVEERDDKIAELKEKIAQYKAREVKSQKLDTSVQEWQAQLMKLATQMGETRAKLGSLQEGA